MHLLCSYHPLIHVCMYVCMYVVGKANLLRGWINTASPSLVPRPSDLTLTYKIAKFSRHSGNSNTESIRECHGITGMSGKFGACANSVYRLPSPPAEGLGTRLGLAVLIQPYTSKCLLLHVPIQCTMYGAVRQTYIYLFKLTICFSILLKVLWKLCTGTHTVGAPASTHNSSSD